MSKNYLDNKNKKYTEADMFQFALDYMEHFQFALMADGCINRKKADLFLTKNIKNYGKNNQKTV